MGDFQTQCNPVRGKGTLFCQVLRCDAKKESRQSYLGSSKTKALLSAAKNARRAAERAEAKG